jgi:hypothetical protein
MSGRSIFADAGEMIVTRLARQFPATVWSRYGRRARAAGFDRLYLVLSFDCDTPEDAEAAARVHAWLRARGIKATYAVPGAQLEQHAATYRRIADEGGRFINHGALPHAEWRGTRYWSVTFYHEMPDGEVVEDITRGHEIVTRTIGTAPSGFRAPHFGLYQKPRQLRVMHGALRALGYRYSTSTLPAFGIARGPVSRINGIVEVPVSGSWDSPLLVLDSWGRIMSPERPEIRDDYADAFIETVDRLTDAGVVGVLNYYVDPAHVHRREPFYRAIAHAIDRGLVAVDYDDLLDQVSA